MMRRQDQAYEKLRRQIIGGHYEPGAQLREEPLAVELGLSRTPIRSALKRLVQDGLATADTGHGVRVAAWTDHDIAEVFDIRILLEPLAAKLAAERGDTALIDGLRRSNRHMADALAKERPDAIVTIQQANRTFHHLLLEHSHSPRLRAILEPLIEMPVIIRSFYIFTKNELEQSLHHHHELTAAVEANNGDLAREIMHLHLRLSQNRFMRHRREVSTL